MTIEHGRDIAELFRRVNNLLRIGKVVEVDYAKAKAKVKIGEITTDFMPWLVPSTAAWIPLKNGEQVVILSPNGDLQMGIILPALYQNAKPAPSSDAAKIAIVADIEQTGGTEISGTLDTKGKITTKSDINASGGIKAAGEVEGKGVQLSTHTHNFMYIGMGQGATPQNATTQKPS